ncbi:MAG: peptidylprolyl isomerase [Thermoanaerobaculia bacterium]
MLKLMRDSFKHLKWILVFIVFLFVLLVFVDWGGGGARSAGPQAFAAQVNGDTISLQEYARSLQNFEDRYQQVYGQPLTEQMRQALGIRQQVLNGLIDDTLLLQEADKLGLTASKEEVRKAVLEIPVLNPDGKFVGAELYSRYVTTRLGYPSSAAFEQDLRRSLTLQKMNDVVLSSVVVPPALAREEYRRRNETASIRYVLLPAQQVAAQVSLTPAEVQSYYNEHASSYSHPEQRRINYLLADVSKFRSNVDVSEDALRQAYDKDKEKFRSPESAHVEHILIKPEPNDAAARQKAEEIVQKLRNGASFAELAKQYSADPGSAAKGGDVGWITKGQTVKPFEDAAFSLPIGTISDPVKSQFGYHIIKVDERRAAGYRPLDEVKPELRMELAEEQAESNAREAISEVRAKLDQAKVTKAEEVRKFTTDRVTFNTTPWFNQNAPEIPGVGSEPDLTKWAFSAKPGSMGPVMQSQRGPIIPFVEAAREAGVPPLAEIRDKVEQDAKISKAREKAAETLAAAMKNAASLDELGKSASLTPVEATISSSGGVAGLAGNVQPLESAALNAPTGKVSGPVVIDQGAVAFEVTSQKKITDQEWAKMKDTFTRSVRQTEALKLRQSLLAKMRRDAKIDVNQTVLQSPAEQSQQNG